MPSIGVRGSLEERFWRRVNRSTPDACWEWTAGRHSGGYGMISLGQKRLYAHRVSYELHHGPLHTDELVRHTCDNPPCVNPAHLTKGTHLSNQHDKMRRGRDRKALGIDNGKAKLTPDQVREIMIEIERAKHSLRAIGRKFGVSVNTIIAIRNGVTWTHVTGIPRNNPQTGKWRERL